MAKTRRSGPLSWWGRSLPFRVVVTTVAAAIVILATTGLFLLDQSSRGIIEGKTQTSLAEATSVIRTLNSQLATIDLGTTSSSEQVRARVREAAERGQVGNQYYLVVETPVARIDSRGLSYDSIPTPMRESVNRADRLCTTPTLIHYTDGRADEPGLVVGGLLTVPGSQPYPIYFVFPTSSEQQTLAVVQQATWATGIFLLVGLAATVYLIALMVLRPVRAARLAAERLAAGHLDDRMAEVGTADLASLATSMNHMASELDKKITELQDLSRVQQRFVSDVSHELRTPMTTIRMAAEVIGARRDQFDPATARSSELLSAEVDRFEELLTELLEISRFDAGAAELHTDEIDLAQLVAEEIAAVEPLAKEVGCQVKLDSDGRALAEVDGRRIRRIVRNLLTNAIEHGDGKPVEVTLRQNADAVALAVRDHGVGLSESDREQVFQRFWRADPARARRVGGTGLGLAISLEDARLHGGWLDVWGEPGAGAQFRLTLARKIGQELSVSPWPQVPQEVANG
ncbi:MAG: HAMP domain-containing histidine kinase [Propionibacteriaceae bacterium]|jgi:two-component system sensor histidine kinase MtrB|nr:HAMP domain-containing histidine kinase [Propionibacteriaceae bacterium]